MKTAMEMPTATFYQPQSILAHQTGSATHNTLKDRHRVVFQEYIFSLGRWPFGWTHDLVFDNEEAYLERWIIWCGFTLRLHKFHKGDDDRAFHDHPWWFITLPLRSYTELTPLGQHRVHAWRPHFRSSRHQHIVQLEKQQPVWTLIITGLKSHEWGFWENGEFIHHEQWLAERQ